MSEKCSEKMEYEGRFMSGCWPFDGGHFVTLPRVVTQDPDTGARFECSTFRVRFGRAPRRMGRFPLVKTDQRQMKLGPAGLALSNSNLRATWMVDR